MIDFEGITLKPEKVLGCSDLKTFSTGPMNCDWEYGFDIYCEGNTIPYHKSMPRFGYAGGSGREDYKKMIGNKRKEFLAMIKDS